MVRERPKQDEATELSPAAVQRFNDAFSRLDVDAVMAAMTEDCIFENTFPLTVASSAGCTGG